MPVIDFIPELLTVGTAASGIVGLYFDRLRKGIERGEPHEIERAANNAVTEAQLEPVAEVALEVNEDGKVVLSQKELQGIMENAMEAAVGTAVTGMKTELAAERAKDRRAGFRSNLAFFIAGIMASAAITLYLHPIG
jgi:hypothetical protein